MTIEWTVETFTDKDSTVPFAEATASLRKTAKAWGTNEENFRFRAALLTYRAAYVEETLALEAGEAGKMTRNDYALSIFGPDVDDNTKPARSASMVTNYRRMGRALVVHGVAFDSPLWRKLSSKANTKTVGELLDSDKPVDGDTLLKACKPASRAAQPSEGEESTPEVGADKPGKVMRDTMKGLRALVKSGGLTVAELKSLSNGLANLRVEVEQQVDAQESAATAASGTEQIAS